MVVLIYSYYVKKEFKVVIHKLIPLDRISRNTGTNSFQIPQCNTTTSKESFYPKTIRDWNTLPSSVTSVSSLESFKQINQ